ncbi:MAG: RHS repeat-associated core domain-containing protein, partial [Leptospiraceae bacterium]|nr:RHS repeat-associated core domain-containing protein [Leptospiraceae bacterium]
TTAGGDVFQYFYDASGNRIKKQLKNANTTTYNFNNLYEIHRSPGEPEKHTMYIPGIEGDKVAQYTRSDALLVQANVNENRYASIFTDNPDQNSIFDQRRNFLEAKTLLTSLYQEIETDIALVLFNIPKHQLYTDNYKMLPSMRVLIWLLAFGILIYYALTINNQDEQTSRRLRLATSFALFPFFFATSAGCSPLFFGGAQGEEGTPPWLLIAAVPANTPSVSDEPTFFGGGSGSGATTTNSSRITGMYFYHPDHLGSITMITDGRGNVLAGGERGGKSHITYRPYGEILRTDSFGPDISKYKYTGQEEDRESGLMYYKARYYDAKIGRFLQQDSMAFPNQIQGMNRMMYVEGNPVSFQDPSGNNKYIHMFNRIVGHAMGKTFGNNSGVKLSSKNFFKGIGNRSSLPRKVGTKEGWKQAVVAGLQTNWDLNAMAQGYYLGQQQAKKQRFDAIQVLSGTIKIILGVVVVIVSYIFGLGWIGYSIGVSLIADGGAEYNEGLGRPKADKGSFLYCGRGEADEDPTDKMATPQPYVCALTRRPSNDE